MAANGNLKPTETDWLRLTVAHLEASLQLVSPPSRQPEGDMQTSFWLLTNS